MSSSGTVPPTERPGASRTQRSWAWLALLVALVPIVAGLGLVDEQRSAPAVLAACLLPLLVAVPTLLVLQRRQPLPQWVLAFAWFGTGMLAVRGALRLVRITVLQDS